MRSAANRASAARSMKWNLVENGGLALISFFSLVVYARFLSAAQFGLYSIALAIIEFLGVVVSMLFHDALVQRSELRDLHYDTAFSTSLALSGVLTALCWLLGPHVSQWTRTPGIGRLLAWMSLCLPFAAAGASLVARRRRELQFRPLALRQLVGRGAGAATGIALVMLGYGLWGLVAQQVLLVALGAATLWLQCVDRPRLRFGKREFLELIGFGATSISALTLHFAVKRVFVFVAGVGLGAQAAGLLNLSFRAVNTFFGMASNPTGQVVLPLLSSVQQDRPRFERAFNSAAALACLALYFGFVLLGALAPEVVQVLFGPRWAGAVPYVAILAFETVVQTWRVLSWNALTALGRPRKLVLSQTAELCVIAFAFAFFGVRSLPWAVAVWVLRDVVAAGLEVRMVSRLMGLKIRQVLRPMSVPATAALAMLAVTWLARNVLPPELAAAARLAILACVGAAGYFGCVALLQRRLLVELLELARSAGFRRPAGADVG